MWSIDKSPSCCSTGPLFWNVFPPLSYPYSCHTYFGGQLKCYVCSKALPGSHVICYIASHMSHRTSNTQLQFHWYCLVIAQVHLPHRRQVWDGEQTEVVFVLWVTSPMSGREHVIKEGGRKWRRMDGWPENCMNDYSLKAVENECMCCWVTVSHMLGVKIKQGLEEYSSSNRKEIH